MWYKPKKGRETTNKTNLIDPIPWTPCSAWRWLQPAPERWNPTVEGASGSGASSPLQVSDQTCPMVESLWETWRQMPTGKRGPILWGRKFFKSSMAWKGLAQPARQLGFPEHQPRGVSSLRAGPKHWFLGKRQHPGEPFLLGGGQGGAPNPSKVQSHDPPLKSRK